MKQTESFLNRFFTTLNEGREEWGVEFVSFVWTFARRATRDSRTEKRFLGFVFRKMHAICIGVLSKREGLGRVHRLNTNAMASSCCSRELAHLFVAEYAAGYTVSFYPHPFICPPFLPLLSKTSISLIRSSVHGVLILSSPRQIRSTFSSWSLRRTSS